MSVQRYRVWVEKHESGWVEVDATDEQMAEDRAYDIVKRGSWRWDPGNESVQAMKAERIADVTP